MKLFARRKAKAKHASQRRDFLLPNRQKTPTSRNRNRILRVFSRVQEAWGIRKSFRWIWLVYLILGAMALFVGLSLISPYFSLKTVTVVRTNPSLEIEKIEQTLKPYKGKNLLFLRSSSMEKDLLRSFSQFDEVNVTEIWPDAVTVRVTLSPPFLSLENKFDANAYPISRKGIALTQTENMPPFTLNFLQFEKPVIAGEKILDTEEVDFFVRINELMSAFFPIKPDSWNYLWAAQELHLTFNGKFILWLDVKQDPKEQIEKLLSAKDEIKLFERGFNHIDLRIPGHIYFE